MAEKKVTRLVKTRKPKSSKDKIAKTQGDLLKSFRDKKKLTQEEIAKSAGMNRQYICRIEKGLYNITPRTAKGLRSLGMTKKAIVAAYTKDISDRYASQI